MRELGQYVITLTCAALVCGLVPSLLKDGAVKSIVRLVCGVFLTVTALAPLTNLGFPDLDIWDSGYMEAGQAAAASGAELALDEKSAFIKAGLEAYILDKAEALGEDIAVHIFLNAEGVPLSIQIRGQVSQENRQILTDVIERDLGIPKEKQQWTG